MNIDIKEFYTRLKIALNAKNNVELAKILDIPYPTLNTWLARNSLPLDVMLNNPAFDKISLDWLLGKEDYEVFDFSKFPSLVAVKEIAMATEDGSLKFNALLDGFLIEDIIEKLLYVYAKTKENVPNNIITKMKRLLFNVTEGRFLMLLDEMISKISRTESIDAKDKIKEIVSGDILHSIISKPIFNRSEKASFQAWAEDLSVEEAEFLVTNADKIHESLKILIPKISKRNSAFDVAVMKKLTS